MMLLEPNYQVFAGSCPSPKSRIAIKALILLIRWQHSDRLMLNALFLAVRFLILVFSGHKQVALENAALSSIGSTRVRSARDGTWMATSQIQTLLVEIVPAETTRTPASALGDRRLVRTYGCR
jgi:hypothetical protein